MQTLSGTMWKLIEASAFDEEGHELTSPLGQHPMGFAMFEAERMMVAVADGRLSLPPDVPSRAFAAYSGRYNFDGTVLVTSVDSASSPDLAGQQIRQIHFESLTRMAATPKNKLLGRDAGLKLVSEKVG
jgi:uncharacterized heparinase superfamily protein